MLLTPQKKYGTLELPYMNKIYAVVIFFILLSSVITHINTLHSYEDVTSSLTPQIRLYTGEGLQYVI